MGGKRDAHQNGARQKNRRAITVHKKRETPSTVDPSRLPIERRSAAQGPHLNAVEKSPHTAVHSQHETPTHERPLLVEPPPLRGDAREAMPAMMAVPAPKQMFSGIQTHYDRTGWVRKVCARLKVRGQTTRIALDLLKRVERTGAGKTGNDRIVALAVVMICCKFEETHTFSVQDFQAVGGDPCEKGRLLAMEVLVLTAVDFRIRAP